MKNAHLLTLFTISAGILHFASPGAHAQEFVPNHLFVANQGAANVTEYDESGNKVRVIATGNSSSPWGVAFGPNGHMFVAVQGGDVVREFDASGTKVNEFGSGFLNTPEGVAFGPNGHIYVASYNGDLVVEFTYAGAFVRNIGTGTTLNGPVAVVVSADGHVWVSACDSSKLYEFAADGKFLQEFTTAGFACPNSMILLPNGNLAASNISDGSIVEFDANGTKITTYGAAASLGNAWGMAFGPDNYIYSADSTAGRVTRLDRTGTVIGSRIGVGDLLDPAGLAFAPFRFEGKLTGNLLAANGAITKINEKVQVSMSPGMQTLMIQLTDGAAAVDLATFFNSTAWVLHGPEIEGSDRKKGEVFNGAQFDGRTLKNGFATAAAQVAWKFITATNFVNITKISANVTRTMPQGMFNGKLTTGKLLK